MAEASVPESQTHVVPSATTTGQLGAENPAPAGIGYPPVFATPEAEQLDRKQKLAATFRMFGKFGFDNVVQLGLDNSTAA